MTLPPGYRSRAAARDDLDALVGLFQAADVADVGFADPARDEIYETWAQPWFDLAKDSLLVEAPDGAIAAYSETVAKDATVDVFVFAKIHPDHRGRGIGAFVAAATEARAAELIPAGVTAPLRNGFPSTDDRAIALFAGRGYAHVRSFWHMERPLEGLEAPPPEPDGITIRPAAAGEDERISWALLEEAFAEHFGYQPLTFDEWLAMWSGFPGYDPTWVLLAFEGDEPVGISIVLPSEDGVAWVGELGVLKPWRRHGIGMALLQRSFAFIASKGYSTVRLGVDTQNTTGATHLYERAGMTVRREYRVVERSVEGTAASG
ncbi:MAG TPA: GNAT family N-acetyltransferase [Actinomycetota bacterium]